MAIAVKIDMHGKIPLWRSDLRIQADSSDNLPCRQTTPWGNESQVHTPVIELKAVDKILPIHEAQLLTYLKLTGLKIGLLINFNNVVLKDGINRIVNNL